MRRFYLTSFSSRNTISKQHSRDSGHLRFVTQKIKTDILDCIAQISEASIRNYIVELQGEKHPEHSPLALKKAGNEIAAQMHLAGLQSHKRPIPGVDAMGDACFNVIGTLPGEDPQKPILLIGAHYDTFLGSPGADDNTSSLAVLLEVARVTRPLFQKTPSALHPQFVAFSLEEPGFVGSIDYVDKTKKNAETLWGAVILECVGFTDHRAGSQRTPPELPISLPDQGDFIGLLGNTGAAPIIQAFETATKYAAPDLPYMSLILPKAAEMIPDVRRSDHVPFWDKDIPALMITDTADFRNPHYHLPSDTLETLNIPFITKVARTLAATIIDLAGLKN